MSGGANMTEPPMTEPKVSFITLSYNSGKYIDRCLGTLVDQGGHEVIHADNGSTDIDLDEMQGNYPTVRQIRHTANLGFAVAMNRAAATATGDWLAFINPDAFLADDWLAVMTSAIAAHPETRLFTSLQTDAEKHDRLDGAGDAMTFFGFPYRMGFGQPTPRDLAPADVFAPCGAAMLVRRDLFEALGGFAESFFCYCEDADLGFRARLVGDRCLFIPEARVGHVGSASTSARSDFALYHGYRNRVWLYVRNMPWWLLLLTLPVHFGMTLMLALNDSRKGKSGLVWKALGDALAGMGPILSQRGLIQRTRQIGTLRLGKSLTWNLQKIANRALDHRSLDHRRPK